MINKIIHLLIVGIVLYIIYFIAGLIVTALSLPGIILTCVGIILLLILIVKILEAFGITF